MADFQVNGKNFRSSRMDLWKQMYVRNRIGPLYPAFAGAKAIMEQDPIMAVRYVTNALRSLSDEDCGYVVHTCLDVVQVQQANLWVDVKTKGTNLLQFKDLTLSDIDLIVFNVLYETFAPFIDALPSLISAVTAQLKKPE